MTADKGIGGLAMQNVTQRRIMPAVNLTCVTTDRFKTGLITVNLITKLSEANASKNALLPRVLRRGTAIHPDIESIACYLDEQYGASVTPVVRKIGEMHCIGLCAEFVDDDFIPGDSEVLENICDLLGEMLLSPATRGGLLLAKYVDSEKKNLIDDIRAGINDKQRYAVSRLIEQMCCSEAYGTNSLGTEASASSINALSLTKHYRKLLESSQIEIFYCGAADIQRVESALLSAFAVLPRTFEPDPILTEVVFEPSADVRVFSDTLDVSQGKMTIGFRIGEIMKAPNYPAITLFNAIFGGAVTSKLFLNVREKLSLCYYASSVIDRMKGVMIVASGVDVSNFKSAYDEIISQLEAVKNGDISDWEFTGAKRYVVDSIRARLDRQSSMESMYFEFGLLGVLFTPEEFAGICDGVTVDEVVEVARSVKIDSVYYLKGTEVSASDEDQKL